MFFNLWQDGPMKPRLNILQSKLAMPVRPDTLERDRLTQKLAAMVEKKLALVVAGAGYGKTTLVAHFLKERGVDTIWYALDESDTDISTFLGYIASGFRKQHPEFGDSFMAEIAHASVSKRSRKTALLSFLMAVQACVRKHTFIVLDDYHLIQDSIEVAEAVLYFLEHIPDRVHFVLISRREPPLKLSRYRVLQDLIDIRESDLVFSTEEIAMLSRCLCGHTLTIERIHTLFEQTGGWIAALILSLNYDEKKPVARMRAGMDSRQLIFQFLEEIIFDGKPADIQSFLLKTAILNHLEPVFINRFLKIDRSQQILELLVRNHLLIFPHGEKGNCFIYHHLLQDFLRDRVVQVYGEETVGCFHFDVARLMEEEGNIQGALHHFLEGRHFSQVSRIITAMMFKDFLECSFTFCVSAYGRIPAEMVQKDANLLYVGAKLNSVRGDIPSAVRAFKIALTRFEADGNETGRLNCAKDLAFHYYLTGDVVTARKRMESLWGKEHKDPFFQIEIAGYLILFSAILGEMASADGVYHAVQKASSGADESRFISSWMDFCYAYKLHASGNFEHANVMNMKVLQAFSSMGIQVLLPLANFQASLTLYFFRQFESGLAHAREGLDLADKFGINDAQLAWLFYARH